MKKFFLGALLSTALPLLAEAEDAPMPPSQGLTQMLMLFAIAIFFFYFILWRPEQKRRKVADEMRDKMKKGDKVNALGIIGTVSQIKENTVVLRMIDGAKIEVVKGAITEVTPCTEEEAKVIESKG